MPEAVDAISEDLDAGVAIEADPEVVRIREAIEEERKKLSERAKAEITAATRIEKLREERNEILIAAESDKRAAEKRDRLREQIHQARDEAEEKAVLVAKTQERIIALEDDQAVAEHKAGRRLLAHLASQRMAVAQQVDQAAEALAEAAGRVMSLAFEMQTICERLQFPAARLPTLQLREVLRRHLDRVPLLVMEGPIIPELRRTSFEVIERDGLVEYIAMVQRRPEPAEAHEQQPVRA